MSQIISTNVVSITFLAAITYSFQNVIEKYIFSKLNYNNNNYLLIRNVLMAIFFYIIYKYFNSYLLSNKDHINKATQHKRDNYYYICIYTLIVLSTLLSIIFSNLTNFGIMKFSMALFTVIFTVLYLMFNIIFGVIFFDEKITYKNMLGYVFGFITVILLN
jgi:drug/metabolite transporter (DMT)-like permease